MRRPRHSALVIEAVKSSLFKKLGAHSDHSATRPSEKSCALIGWCDGVGQGFRARHVGSVWTIFHRYRRGMV